MGVHAIILIRVQWPPIEEERLSDAGIFLTPEPVRKIYSRKSLSYLLPS